MTAQLGENLRYNDQDLSMCTDPLSDYFALGGKLPPSRFDIRWSTALWRGHLGSWEIVSDRLYLIKLIGRLEDGSALSLATLFPDFPDRVFAHWYTGKLRIPQGKLLKYVHQGYQSTYERDLFLEIEKGILTGSHVRHNGVSEVEGGPEGYGIRGMTIFPSKNNQPEDTHDLP